MKKKTLKAENRKLKDCIKAAIRSNTIILDGYTRLERENLKLKRADSLDSLRYAIGNLKLPAKAQVADRFSTFAGFDPSATKKPSNQEAKQPFAPVVSPCRCGSEEKAAEPMVPKYALDSVYRERNQLVAALSKCFPSCLIKHQPKPEEDWDPEWESIVVIDLPTGQATWHIHVSEYKMFSHLDYSNSVVWDGHTTKEKYHRLAVLPPILEHLTPDHFYVRSTGGTVADEADAQEQKFIEELGTAAATIPPIDERNFQEMKASQAVAAQRNNAQERAREAGPIEQRIGAE